MEVNDERQLLKLLRQRSRFRPVIECGVCLVMAVVVARLWILDSLPTACRVSGGSMAETLLGTHRAVVCADCGHRFPCDAESASPCDKRPCVPTAAMSAILRNHLRTRTAISYGSIGHRFAFAGLGAGSLPRFGVLIGAKKSR